VLDPPLAAFSAAGGVGLLLEPSASRVLFRMQCDDA
jgi:hypothetical protein